MSDVTERRRRPQWGAEVVKRLWLLEISQIQLAQMINRNYNSVSNTITGFSNNLKIKNLILEKLDELEKEGAV